MQCCVDGVSCIRLVQPHYLLLLSLFFGIPIPASYDDGSGYTSKHTGAIIIIITILIMIEIIRRWNYIVV